MNGAVLGKRTRARRKDGESSTRGVDKADGGCVGISLGLDSVEFEYVIRRASHRPRWSDCGQVD
jgi:hypothetical protein